MTTAEGANRLSGSDGAHTQEDAPGLRYSTEDSADPDAPPLSSPPMMNMVSVGLALEASTCYNNADAHTIDNSQSAATPPGLHGRAGRPATRCIGDIQELNAGQIPAADRVQSSACVPESRVSRKPLAIDTRMRARAPAPCMHMHMHCTYVHARIRWLALARATAPALITHRQFQQPKRAETLSWSGRKSIRWRWRSSPG
jgi:hypothetical protein